MRYPCGGDFVGEVAAGETNRWRWYPIMGPSSVARAACLGAPDRASRIMPSGHRGMASVRRPGRGRNTAPGAAYRSSTTARRSRTPTRSRIVGQKYWQNIGLELRRQRHRALFYITYWSAAFHLLCDDAGRPVPEADFPRSRRHMTWIHHAIRNKLDGVAGAKLLGHRVTDLRRRKAISSAIRGRAGWTMPTPAARLGAHPTATSWSYAWGSRSAS